MLATEYTRNRVGGLGAHMRALVPRLSDRVAVNLFLPRYDPSWEAHETVGRFGRVTRIDAVMPRLNGDFVGQVWSMNDALNAYISGLLNGAGGFDLIHAHDWLVGFVANDLRRRYHIPLVVTFHALEIGRIGGHPPTTELSKAIHRAEWHLAQEADLIITCSRFMHRETITHLEVPADKVVVIPNAVDAATFVGLRHQKSALAAFRSRWAAPDEPLIFYVGRLVGEKGVDLLVEAMAEVCREKPQARAIIAGKGPEEYTRQLQETIARLGLERRVELVGFITDEERDRFYGVADVAVFPSRYEPFGIVALEAMAAGIPVVVAEGSGLAEVVEHGRTGLHVARNSASALAQGILQVLRHPEAAQARAREAQAVVRAHYNWDQVAEQTLAAYDQALERARAVRA
ncbi:MAG: glycosyltransferase family 4 protein [Anaerolineae bacterium]|nr:glycosyltransferase family 4 protein [Caldilineales bacterium]MDW8270333.1 glycosyltransferase family 4 protein [Anaerolineae bacterium]